MTLADVDPTVQYITALCALIIALAGAIAVVAKVVLWAARRVATEQDDRIGERVAKEMAPVSQQVHAYSEDVKKALGEFRAGERRTNTEFLSVWKTLAQAGINRPEEGGGT